MDKKTMEFVVQKTQELIKAPTCSKETKVAAQNWLKALGSEQEATETKKYIDELEADIIPIDQLIGFAGSEAGVQYFGKETANNILEHGKEIKSAGANYCDCPACAAVAQILDIKDSVLK